MALGKIHNVQTVQRSRSRFAEFTRAATNNPFTLTPWGMLGHIVGWIWGEMEGSGSSSVGSRKQGTKLPGSYIILGDLDEVWDDKK